MPGRSCGSSTCSVPKPAAQLLPPALARLATRYPALRPQVFVVPELGRGTAGEVTDGHADLAISTLATDEKPLAGLVTRELLREPFLLAAPADHPDPRALPLIDWPENCSSYTRAWWARQQWLPTATINADDDGVVLSMVAQGLGLAILPRLTLADPPAGVRVTSLGDAPPVLRIVCVTTRATASSIAVRELLRELQATASRSRSAINGISQVAEHDVQADEAVLGMVEGRGRRADDLEPERRVQVHSRSV
jgi:DNA-binding transcriptional LysR family regulator